MVWLTSRAAGRTTSLRPNASSCLVRRAARSPGGADVDHHLVAGLSRRDLLFEQLAVAEHGGQKIVEVMGDAAGQASHRFHLLRLAAFPFAAARFLFAALAGADIAYVELGNPPLAFGVDGAHHLDFHALAVSGKNGGGLLGRIVFVAAGCETFVHGGAAEYRRLPEFLADQAVAGITAKPGDNRVDIENFAAGGIRDDDAVHGGFEKAAIADFGGLPPRAHVEQR